MSQKLPEIRDLKSLLEKHFDKTVEIIKCDTKFLTAPGENYGSVMLEVNVLVKIEDVEKCLNLVAKLCPTNEIFWDIFKIQESVPKELAVYVDVVPALAQFEDEFGIQENRVSDMFAKCFGGRFNLKSDVSTKIDNDAVILLENLKIKGYYVCDRMKGFDLDHIELIINHLAALHAEPIALKLLKPEVFKEKILPALKNIAAGSLDNEMAEFAKNDIMRHIKANDKCLPYLDKITKQLEFSIKGKNRVIEPTEPFSTICHTDLWVNNTMILKNKDGIPIHNIFVDFQLPIYASGTYDLLFLLYSSLEPKLLDKKMDYLIKLYHTTFIERLSLFNIDLTPFSWENFLKDIKDIAPTELGHILIMYRPIFTKPGSITENMDEDQMLDISILSDDYPERTLKCVLSYIDRKWLD